MILRICLRLVAMSLICTLVVAAMPLRAAPPPATVQAAGDNRWDSRFGPPGVDGGGYTVNLRLGQEFDNTQVLALAVSGDDVYVGGRFTTAGGVSTNNIARWNRVTNTWSALGSGLNGGVAAIAVSGDTVYVGGNFTKAGSVDAIHVAAWDRASNSWSALGAGLGDPAGTGERVAALVLSGNVLYAAGSFARAGTLPVNNIARWDGNSWAALSAGVNNRVDTLAADGAGGLYAGGSFDVAGGVPAAGVARWDGSAWAALGDGISGGDALVNAIAVQGDNVFVSGDFSSAGGVGARNIARWDGSDWSPLGEGINTIFGVNALTLIGSDLYAGGSFQEAGGQRSFNIARWDGGDWSALGNGTAGSISALATGGTTLYAGGFFTLAGDALANKIARWDGTTWSPLGPGWPQGGVQQTVTSVAVNGNDVYVGGFFKEVGKEPDPFDNRTDRFRSLARWDATNATWTALGQFGLSDALWNVSAIVADDNGAYIGGRFFKLDADFKAYGIVRWDKRSNNWVSLGGGVGKPEEPSASSPAEVNAIALGPGGDVYAAGNFVFAGGNVVNNIARWNGSAWSALGDGIGGNQPQVNAVAVAGGKVYAGGQFATAGGVSANGLAVWDGSRWAAVDPSFNGVVYTIAFQGTTMYVGGSFTAAGLPGTTQIARWDGSRWSALGVGVAVPDNDDFPLAVYAIAFNGNDVYVGGNFTLAGGVPTNGVARWDGSRWSALGSGVYGGGPQLGSYVGALAVSGSSLYVGGNFTAAGGKPSSYVARFDLAGSDAADGSRILVPLVRR